MKSACSFVCVVFSPLHFRLPKQRAVGKGGSEEQALAQQGNSLLHPGHEENPFPLTYTHPTTHCQGAPAGKRLQEDGQPARGPVGCWE